MIQIEGTTQDISEKKRSVLIQKLVAFNIYKKEDEFLFERPLSELEEEYHACLSNSHPHENVHSIKIVKTKNKQ